MIKKYLSVLCALLVGISGFSIPAKAEEGAEAGEEAELLNEQVYGDLVYENIDGEIRIIRCNKGVTFADIPDEINGYPVTMIGDAAFSECTAMTVVSIPSTVKSIGNNAFNGCTALQSVRFLSAGLISIGNYAFKNCTSLESLKLSDLVETIGNYAFQNCTALKHVTIPRYVTKIGSSAFAGCTGIITAGQSSENNYIFDWVDIPDYAFANLTYLESVELNDATCSIGSNAFTNCTSLKKITVPGTVKTIGINAFRYCSKLTTAGPAGGGYDYEFGWTDEIPQYAFQNCSGITSINLPASITAIGNSAFSGCSSLKDITIPNGVTVIRNGTFNGCTSLTDMTLPEGLTKIEDYAFARTGITAIVVPGNVTSIGNMAFTDCRALAKISVPEKASFTGPAFQNCTSLKTAGPAGGGYDYEFGWKSGIPDYAFSQCAGLTSVTLPDSITRIGKEAFYACAGLSSVHVPDNVTYIGERAFAYSENLETVSGMNGVSAVGSDAFLGTKVRVLSFGKGVEVNMYSYSDYPYIEEFKFIRGDVIGSLAFENCAALKKVWINHSVTEIADGVFSGCTSLETVYFHGTKAEWNKITIGENNEPLQNAEIVYLPPLTAVKLNSTSVTLEPGKTFDLKLITTPSDAYMGDVQTEWKVSSGTDVIRIDQNGKITAVKNGSAEVTATVTDRMDDKKFTVKCSVTVGAEDSVTAFVKRLYRLCFNREADAGGLNGWVTKLKNGTSTAAQVVQAFFTSKEMQNLKLSNGDFVERCYLVMMGRASDAGGKKGWVEKLDAGMSVNYVLRGFVASREFANICREYGIVQGTINCPENRDQNQGITAFVSRCYSEVLGRKADTGGLNNWCGKILNAADKKQEAINTASNGFFHSPEYLNKNTTNDQYVRTLYRTFLGREADTGGYNNWMAKLNSGQSRDSVMNGFAYSAEFANIMAKYGIR